MIENDLEGTLVLERLAEIDKLDEFFEAINSDDFSRARKIMKSANIDLRTIETVLHQMSDSDHRH